MEPTPTILFKNHTGEELAVLLAPFGVNPKPCSSHVEREILCGHHSVHRTKNLHFLACSEMAPLLSPVLNAESITGMTSATWVVDESHCCLSEGECERIVRVCVLWHAARETKEDRSRAPMQDLLQK